MWALLHAWCSRPVVGFVAIIFAPVAWAHHGADLADELPLWQIISVAAVVALCFIGAHALPNWFARTRMQRRATSEDEPAR